MNEDQLRSVFLAHYILGVVVGFITGIIVCNILL